MLQRRSPATNKRAIIIIGGLVAAILGLGITLDAVLATDDGDDTSGDPYGVAAGDWVEISAPTTDKTIARKVAIVPGMHARVVNAEGLWYMPGEDLIEGTLAVGANVLTPLRDDVDPILGGSIARCILCSIVKLEGKTPDFRQWAQRQMARAA